MKFLFRSRVVLAVQLLVVATFLVAPAISQFIMSGSTGQSLHVMAVVARGLLPLSVVYFAQFYVLLPQYGEDHRKAFAVGSLALWLFLFAAMTAMGLHAATDFGMFVLVMAGYSLFWLLVVSLLAWLTFAPFQTSYYKKQLSEERQRNTEAELAWLKNQLNPHFLFNTLNNISSLSQIDADRCQQSIEQLSDLLRYCIYRASHPVVAIGEEVAFLENYIQLMRLRYAPTADIQWHSEVVDVNLTMPPLLLLSFVENAFKHGIDSDRPSFVHIRLNADAHTVHFICENTNHPKTSADKSGSGIGLENTRRRLNLLYPARHSLKVGLRPGGIYGVELMLNTEQ